MIEITEGFTSITAGADSIGGPSRPSAFGSPTQGRRTATGARVTLEFRRADALPADLPVRVRYEFGDRGITRELVGIPTPTHVEARPGRAVVHHYRLSHWIAAGELAGRARPATALPQANGPELPRADPIPA